MTQQDQYYELSYYTLAHTHKNFIHQHIVDAYTAQTAEPHIKPIAIFFALAGLYLFVDHNYTGRQVQDAHLHMSKQPKNFPEIKLPVNRGKITVTEVLNEPPGTGRDDMIAQWCISVWSAFSEEHNIIKAYTENLLRDTQFQPI